LLCQVVLVNARISAVLSCGAPVVTVSVLLVFSV